MKRIHFFQHVPFETPGCISHWAEDRGYAVTFTKFYEGGEFPSADEIDWLVIMGGPMSVHDTGIYPWLKGEKRFIETAVTSGKTVIGVCLGAQLVAEVLGSVVRSNREKEIGWHRIFRTDEISSGAFFDLIPDGEEVFHWHGETFDIPAGSVHGFTSDCCRNQAFLFDERVLGLQFHMEITPHLLHEMVNNCRGELVPSEYVQGEESILAGMHHISRNNSIMYSILDSLDPDSSMYL